VVVTAELPGKSTDVLLGAAFKGTPVSLTIQHFVPAGQQLVSWWWQYLGSRAVSARTALVKQAGVNFVHEGRMRW
jgi:hypothetical protein